MPHYRRNSPLRSGWAYRSDFLVSLFLVTIAFCAVPLISYVAIDTNGQEPEAVTFRVVGDHGGSDRTALVRDARFESRRSTSQFLSRKNMRISARTADEIAQSLIK